MLSLRRISLTDFGPFKGDQSIDFPVEGGVTIIYGENMRGKTTLLNAVRYALFGKVIARGENPAMLHQIGNWETVSDKRKFGFKVVLEFEHDGKSYELTREHKPRSGISTPQTDLDYQQDCFLRKDGTVLGPDQRDSEIARIMPETVSRFFLFDGELLQQYEELLRNESDMGRSIKEAIERILGVPILTNARSDLSELLKDAQKREAKAAQKNQKTQSLGNMHEGLLKQRDGLQQETSRLRNDLDLLKTQKVSREEALRKMEKVKSLLDEKTRLQEEISVADTRLKEKELRRSDLLAHSWKGLLIGRIKKIRELADKELKAFRVQYEHLLVSAELTEKIRQAIDTGKCTTCEQELSAAAAKHLSDIISRVVPEGDKKQLQVKIQELENRIRNLNQSHDPGNIEILREVQSSINDFKIKKAMASDRLADLQRETKDLDEAEIRRLYAEYERTLSEIGVLQNGIKSQEIALKQVDEDISKVEAEMAKFADADLDAERDRKELCEKIRALVADAVDAYRERLRGRVEADATALFLELTSEPDYSGLRINDSYGLKILHKDGSEIPVRSAGAEHIVALSLMGALQRNAPLRGPIIMDSPFGRLDSAHTTKVIGALPNMAEHVMLLVYESELDPDEARNQLKGKLRKEYRIVRRSARHSNLEPIA